mgnify:CR=1 FL=1
MASNHEESSDVISETGTPLTVTRVVPAASPLASAGARSDGMTPAVDVDHASDETFTGSPVESMLDLMSPGDVLADRYELQAVIGAGAFGRVFAGHDRQRFRDVAIKVLRDPRPESLLRFKQEFRALAELRHPNLVRLHKLGRSRDLWFIVMDLVDGHAINGDSALPCAGDDDATSLAAQTAMLPPNSLRDHLRAQQSDGREEPVLDQQVIRSRILQLANGLDYLHAHGIVHCDLKPSNVLVDRDGRVALLDFGVARFTRHVGEHHQTPRSNAGTLPYMPPEAIRGDFPTPAVDWYACGIMLAEMLTGLAPDQLMRMRPDVRARRLAEVAARRSEPGWAGLYELAIGLLAPEPEQRVGYAEVLACCDDAQADGLLPPAMPDVGSFAGGADGTGTSSSLIVDGTAGSHTSDPIAVGSTSDAGSSISGRDGTGSSRTGSASRSGSSTTSGPLTTRRTTVGSADCVGRDGHFAELDDAYERFLRGGRVHLLVEGEAGIGKSTLIRTFLQRLTRRRDAPAVLVARCRNDELLGFRAFDELMDGVAGLLSTLPPEQRRAMTPQHASALCAVFPTLTGVLPSGTTSGQVDPTLALQATRELLYRLSRIRRVVIWIDDMHWADRDSLHWIARVFAPGTTPELMLLMSRRPDAHGAEPDVDASTLGYAVPILRLKGLAPEVCEAASERWLPADLRSDRELAARLAELSGGHPYVLRELCRNAELARGLIGRMTLAELMRLRLGAIDDESRQTLLPLCCAFAPLGTTDIAPLTGLPARTVALALDRLEEAGLIRLSSQSDGEQYEPAHDAIVRASQETSAPEAVRRTHGALADQAMRGERSLAPTTIVAHLVRAGRAAEAGTFAAEVASDAEINGAHDLRAQMLVLLLDIERRASGAAERGSLLAAGRALIRAGRGPEGAALLQEAAEREHAVSALPLRREAAEALMVSGHIAEGLEISQALARSVGAVQRRSRIATILSVPLLQGRVDRALRHLERAMDGSLDPIEQLQLEVYRMLGADLGMVDSARGLEFQMRELLLAARSGDARQVIPSMCAYAVFLSLSGGARLRRGRQLLDLAHRLAEQLDDALIREWIKVCDGMIDYHDGRFLQAWQRMEEGRTWIERHAPSERMLLGQLEIYRLLLLHLFGEIGALREAYYGMIVSARTRRDRFLEATVSLTGASTWLVDDAPDAGTQHLARLQWDNPLGGYQLQDYIRMRARCETALYQGADARQLRVHLRDARAFERTLLCQSFRICRMEGRWLQGRLLLATAGDGAPSWRVARRVRSLARGLLRESGVPFGPGWGHLLLAGLHQRRGDHVEAAESLRRAIAVFQDAGLVLYERTSQLTLARVTRGSAMGPARDELLQRGVMRPELLARVYIPGF